MADSDISKLLLVIIAILIPPMAVGMKMGMSTQLFLSIVPTLLL